MVTSLRSARWWTVVAAGGVGLLVLAFVVPTVLPGVGFWDTAEFQTVGPVLGTAHPTGFPAYVVLGWLASVVLQPLGDPAFRMNLLSALLVGLSAAVTVVLVRALTASLVLGIVAGLAVGTNPIVWRIGTQADAHALHLALVALLLLALVGWQSDRARGGSDRWLVAASAIFGVSVANHSLTLLLAPAVAAYVLAVDPALWRRIGLVARCAVVLFGTAALLYLELPLRAGMFPAPLVYGEPHTVEGFRYIVLAEQFRGSIVDPFGDLAGKFRSLVDLTVDQFGAVSPLLPIAWLVAMVRVPRYAVLTGLATAITVFFAASYQNADITRYYLGPVLMAWTWLAILAAAAADVVGDRAPAGTVRAPSATEPGSDPDTADGHLVPNRGAASRRGLGASPVLAALLGLALLIPTVADLGARARAVDRSSDDSAARWLDAAVARLPADAVVISWWSYSTPLWYAQHVEGRLPGVFIVDDRTRLDLQLGEVNQVIDQFLDERPVYVIRSDGGELVQLGRTYALDPGPVANTLVRVGGRVEASR